MGARSGSKVDHMLFGSDTSSVIDHSTCPVLIASASGSIKKINRVMFATDFKEADIYAIEYLIELSEFFEYEFEIVHVTLYGDHIPHENKVKDFIKQLKATKYPKIIFQEIMGKDLLSGLDQWCEEREPDILALTHLQHSLFKRMLREGNVKKALSNQKLPLFIFPSSSKSKYNSR